MPAQRQLFPQRLGSSGGQGFIICQAWKRWNLKAAEQSKVRSSWKTSIFAVFHRQSALADTSSC